MLDVHAPHSKIEGIKEFLLHLFTISVGLLIAVGIEGCVERYHHFRSRGRTSRTSLVRPGGSGSLPTHPVPISGGPLAPHLGHRKRRHKATMGTSCIPQAMNRPKSIRALWPQGQLP